MVPAGRKLLTMGQDQPHAIETSLVGDNTDRAWGGLLGTPDLPETILVIRV